MEKDYYVFYHRDLKTEKTNKYGDKMLFDDARTFGSKEKARNFAYDNLPALVMKRIKNSAESKEYLIAARFEGKYHHYDYSGGSDALTNYDIARRSKDSLEKTVDSFAEEGAKEIIVGIEDRLFG